MNMKNFLLALLCVSSLVMVSCRSRATKNRNAKNKTAQIPPTATGTSAQQVILDQTIAPYAQSRRLHHI